MGKIFSPTHPLLIIIVCYCVCVKTSSPISHNRFLYFGSIDDWLVTVWVLVQINNDNYTSISSKIKKIPLSWPGRTNWFWFCTQSWVSTSTCIWLRVHLNVFFFFFFRLTLIIWEFEWFTVCVCKTVGPILTHYLINNLAMKHNFSSWPTRK